MHSVTLIITPTLMHIELTTAIRRGFELSECLLVYLTFIYTSADGYEPLIAYCRYNDEVIVV